MKKNKSEKANILEMTVLKVSQGRVTFHLLGTSPVILHAFSQKARMELLLGKSTKTQVDKELNEKHNPPEEFRSSVVRAQRPESPTEIVFKGGAFKEALTSVATDMPGTVKAPIDRNTNVPDEYVPIFGIPKLYTRMVRCSDIARTPDVRTRAIIEHWAAIVTVVFTEPIMTDQKVANLLAAAGLMCGIGDWRPQKGGSHGQFELVSANDPRFLAIVKAGGRAAQQKALTTPQCYDEESANAVTYFLEETARRQSLVGKRKDLKESKQAA